MNKSEAEFYRKLRSTFSIEAHEHMRNISLSLVDLETCDDANERKKIVEIIHREFHSLKGAARAVDIFEIETICHALESIFADVKKGIINISAEMFDIFNKALEVIEEILLLDIEETLDISEIINHITNIKSKDINKNDDLVTKKDSFIYKEVVNETGVKKNPESNEKVLLENIQVKQSFHDSSMDSIRVSKNKLDSLLIQGEEMLYAKLSIKQRESEIKELKDFWDGWKKKNSYYDLDGLDKRIDSLLSSTINDGQVVETMLNRFIDDVKDLMLLPFSSIIEIFPKMIRDISRKQGKDIAFTYSGVEFEIDRRILEEIKDPLIHIIRNSIDHGIESIEERKKLNKNTKGTISFNISQVGSGYVQIQISDDGAGIDIEKLKSKAVENKLYSKSEVDILTAHDAQMLIFKSGISTKNIITDLSGRGLGLAIVREKIEKLEGSIYVKSKKDKGTVFEILLPITISTNRGIVISVSKQKFIVPTSKISKVIKVNKNEIKSMEGRATITVDDYIIPIVKMRHILKLQEYKDDDNDNFISLLIVNELDKKIAFSVDEIITEQEVLVKQFNKQLTKVRNISGATILGTGEVVPILEVQDLIKSSLNFISTNSFLKKNSEEVSEKSIIVVDDSITSRTLLKNVLENKGYKVKTYVDGLEGWKAIKSEKFDLIISDVEMPKMNGFELTEKVRSDEGTAHIPVVLVTSLDSKEDTERGIEVGASAYIVKSSFQQNNLIEVINKLI